MVSYYEDVKASLDGVALHNNGGYGLSIRAYDGDIDATLRNMSVIDNYDDGIYLEAERNIYANLSNIAAHGNYYAILLDQNSYGGKVETTMRHIDASDNGDGINIFAYGDVSALLENIVADDTYDGLYISTDGNVDVTLSGFRSVASSHGTRVFGNDIVVDFEDVKVRNNDYDGTHLYGEGSVSFYLQNVTASGNGGRGVQIEGYYGDISGTLKDVIANDNGETGIWIYNHTGTSTVNLDNVNASGNGIDDILITP